MLRLASSMRPAAKQAARSLSTSARLERDMARMTLIGRLGAQPERRQTKNGKDFLIYKVATSDPLLPAKEGEKAPEPTTSWHTIFAHGSVIDKLETLEKGQVIVLVHRTLVAMLTRDVPNVQSDSGEYKTIVLAKHDRLFVISKPKAKAESEPAAEE
ncbi:ssDNA-binding protein, mitochondrial [Microbotryomycetes sp. JL201]|nr:ssDNA-binding protein, mitochondrial [Microbotryomycetes sp. JL201]